MALVGLVARFAKWGRFAACMYLSKSSTEKEGSERKHNLRMSECSPRSTATLEPHRRCLPWLPSSQIKLVMIRPGIKLYNWGSRRPPPNYHSIASATAGSLNYIVYSYMEFERRDAMGVKRGDLRMRMGLFNAWLSTCISSVVWYINAGLVVAFWSWREVGPTWWCGFMRSQRNS
jgi:hypothetical protein